MPLTSGRWSFHGRPAWPWWERSGKKDWILSHWASVRSKRYMGGLLQETSHLARRGLPLFYAPDRFSETTYRVSDGKVVWRTPFEREFSVPIKSHVVYVSDDGSRLVI